MKQQNQSIEQQRRRVSPSKALLLVVAAAGSGCATRSMYQEANSNFAEGLDAANQTLTAVLGSHARNLRLQAIGFYINNGDRSTNLDSGDVNNSFARYVCAGYGMFAEEFGSLNTLQAYKAHIAELSKQPSDDLSELIASLRSLKKPQPVLSLPAGKVSEELQRRCREEVLVNVPPGRPLDRAEVEGVPAMLSFQSQVEALVSSLKGAAIELLKIADDTQRVKALQKYVLNNEDTINAIFNGKQENGAEVLRGLSKTEALALAWNTRQNAALVAPYYRFEYMLTMLDRSKDVEKILKQEAAINESLASYDRLGSTPGPEDLINKMEEAQADLVRLARGEVKPGEAWAAFVSFTDSVTAVRDAVDTATTTVQEFE